MPTFAARSMDVTERLLDDSGLVAGMRVLDIGCHRGDLALMVARRVGPDGHVLGLDRNGEAVAAARERAAEQQLGWVHFADGDLDRVDLGRDTFDAIVCRRVLMYLPDPAATLGRLLTWLRPGGRVIVQEHDATMVPGRVSPLPLHEMLISIVWRTLAAEGADPHVGFRLPAIFTAAGLRLEHIHAEAVIRTGGHASDSGLHDWGAVLSMMLPRLRAQGVAEADGIDLGTIEAQLREELAAAGSAFVGDMVFCAFARKPGGA
jgi:SAM-dependent methyltransferase